jgi:hypothetical protein
MQKLTAEIASYDRHVKFGELTEANWITVTMEFGL